MRYAVSFAAICMLFTLATTARAAEVSETAVKSSISTDIQALIRGPADIPVGRTVVLDASLSIVNGESVEYRWYLGKSREPISRTVEAIYTPEKAGTLQFRLLITAVVDGQKKEAESFHEITAYNRKIILIANPDIPQEKLLLHEEFAKDNGVFLRTIQPPPSSLPLHNEEDLANFLSEQKDSLNGAEAVVLWTDHLSGLHALMRFVSRDAEKANIINKQTLILISDRSLTTIARTARGPFTILEPQKIVITRKEA